MEVERGEDFEVCWESGETGQEGTVALMLIDNDGNTVWVFSTADIAENAPPSGVYCAQRTAPVVVGHYTLIFSIDGTLDADSISTTDLYVTPVGVTSGPPLTPGGDGAGPDVGPCFGWVAAEDVATCCSVELGTDFDLFEGAASTASQVLFELSARRWPGQCERVVRAGLDWPCGLQVTSGGVLIGWERTETPSYKVHLPNYPVTEILEVKVDGDVVPADEYRLDGWRWLTRLADAEGDRQYWPSWGRDDREDDEEDTFSVRYTFGVNPPLAGVDAAAQLACEIYKSCPGNEGVDGGACALPKGATRVTRAGITIELGSFHWTAKEGWNTGMKLVDLFLNTYNPRRLRRAPMIWSPDEAIAYEVGTAAGS